MSLYLCQQKGISSKVEAENRSDPEDIQVSLVKNELLESYNARPPYQRNDYLGWISQAKLDATKQKRINQMLDELKQGGRYMKMPWKNDA